MKVIILGSGEMLLNLIRGALLAEVDIAGVFRYDRLIYSPLKLFWHDRFHDSPVLTLMKKHKIYDIPCRSANSEAFKREVLRLNADIILVGSWREKLKKEIINLPRIAAINVHPSLLPKYRGPNPYIQAIRHMEEKSGVTFHLMDENFDTGAILAQAEVDILKGDTSRELKNKVVFRARMLCASLLESLKTGVIEPIPQNEETASYFHNVEPEDMTLDFKIETAEEICAHVRAFHPFLPTYIQLKNKFYIVNPYKISIVDEVGSVGEVLQNNIKNKSLTIAAKDGKGVKFDELRLYSRWHACENLAKL